MSISGGGASSAQSAVNPEELRRWLGRRLEEVSKKEAAADKLAMEWEERMELIDALDACTLLDQREALEKKLAKKEGRIRQLSKMLGKGMLGEAKDRGQKDSGAKKAVSFLTSKEFKSMHGDKPVTVDTAELGMKTLFGMVVRERRRGERTRSEATSWLHFLTKFYALFARRSREPRKVHLDVRGTRSQGRT